MPFIVHFDLFRSCFLGVFAQLYDIKYSCLIQIICAQLNGFKYSYLILLNIWFHVNISC